MNNKPCGKCKFIKPLTAFSFDKKMRLGRSSWCYKCCKIWRDTHKRYWKKKNKDWWNKHPDYHLMYNRLEKYGLSSHDIQKLLQKQNFKCAICKTSFNIKQKEHIDHNHQKGYIRGLLCRKCNLGIGFLQDSPKILMSAIVYLKRRLLNGQRAKD